MTQQIINVGASANDGQGDPIRTAFIKCNNNFSQLYSVAQSSPPLTLTGSIGDFAGMYAYDSTYFYYCFANYTGNTTIWAQIAQIGNISVSTINDGTSNISIVGSGSNAVVNIGGVPNVAVFSTGGVLVRGVVSASGNVRGGNINTNNDVSASGNVFGTYIFGNGSQLTGLPVTYSNANVAAYLPVYSGNIGSGNLLTTGIVSAGGNIVGNNISASSTISATGNIVTNGYFVGNFAGNITGNLVVPGSNTDVLFNTNGNSDAVAGMTYKKDTNTFVVLGTVSSQGNTIGGNIVTAGLITATGNLYAGNIINLGIESVTGNIIGGNILTAGVVSAAGGLNTGTTIIAAGNIRGGNLISNGLVTVTGNIQGGNFLTAGVVSAVGNITGAYFSSGNDINAGGNVSAVNYTGARASVTGNITGGNILTSGLISSTSNIISNNNFIAGNGLLAEGSYTGIYPDGIVVDYVTGNGRISTSSGDGLQFYNQGLANTWVGGFTANGTFSATGNVVAGQTLTVGNLTISSNTISSSTSVITLGSTGNIGNIVIAGNLQVLGTTTTIYSNTITTNDLIIYTANNAATASDATGGGIGVGPSTGPYAQLTYNSTSNIWATNIGISVTGTITGGNLSVGTGTITGGNIVNANANGVGNIGSSTLYFNTVFAKATSAQYADLAEKYTADTEYTPGTIVCFGGSAEITQCNTDACPVVAGVVSTDPAYLMNSGLTGTHTVAVALVGRVPCQVQGLVTRGAMMVSAGNGRARAEANPAMGTVIGKALQAFDGDIGTIEIVVGRL